MSGSSTYSSLDRFLHRLAFAGTELQKNISEMESLSAKAELASVPIRRPIFITALPRAGTTLLLETVVAMGNVATHTYRDMPFVLCPLTWDKLSRGFRVDSAVRERAHGDGMMVGYDSAEAFEEVVWKAFFPKKYHLDRIDLWTVADRDPEFEIFFREHIKKLILLRAPAAKGPQRYASKNNANIARIALLRAKFPDCDIVVPFRDPLSQSMSLLRQHRNFLAVHERDQFARRYMESLGHYEFGSALRPISFPSNDLESWSPDTIEFWIAYWIAAYAWILQQRPCGLVLLNYDGFVANPAKYGEALGQKLGLTSVAELGHIRPARAYDIDRGGLPADLLARAQDIHGQLVGGALAS